MEQCYLLPKNHGPATEIKKFGLGLRMLSGFVGKGHIYRRKGAIQQKMVFHQNWNIFFKHPNPQMKFSTQLVVEQGYLLPKNHRTSC